MRYKHLKTGAIYEVVGKAQIQSKEGLKDYDDVTIYRGSDGLLWVRKNTEFYERFEEVVDNTPLFHHSV